MTAPTWSARAMRRLLAAPVATDARALPSAAATEDAGAHWSAVLPMHRDDLVSPGRYACAAHSAGHGGVTARACCQHHVLGFLPSARSREQGHERSAQRSCCCRQQGCAAEQGGKRCVKCACAGGAARSKTCTRASSTSATTISWPARTGLQKNVINVKSRFYTIP